MTPAASISAADRLGVIGAGFTQAPDRFGVVGADSIVRSCRMSFFAV